MSTTRYTGTAPLVSIPDMRPSGRNMHYDEMRHGPGPGYPGPGYQAYRLPDGSLSGPPLRDPSLAEDDDSAIRASELDDSVGNGIFDGPGAPPIQNAGNGVFECNWAEPGYLYRERLTRPSPIMDARTGSPIMSLPAGGSWPNHLSQAYRPWDDETPRLWAAGETDVSKAAAERPVWEWAVAGAVAGIALAVLGRYL